MCQAFLSLARGSRWVPREPFDSLGGGGVYSWEAQQAEEVDPPNHAASGVEELNQLGMTPLIPPKLTAPLGGLQEFIP